MHTVDQPDQGFHSTGLSPVILSAVSKAGFTVPTPIQAQAIPVGVSGRDIIGLAETGTGKTMAFALPILDRLLVNKHEQALILVPTRELALQVEESIRSITRLLNPSVRTVSLIGGMPIYRQIRDLRNYSPRILVATPGRLRDHLEQRTVRLDAISVLVLDEADRMLDMGFAPQITFICKQLPTNRQTMLFSATFAPEIAALARQFQQEPVRIEVAKAGTSAKNIKQELVYVPHEEKMDVLRLLLDTHTGTVLVFSRTKHGAGKLSRRIYSFGHSSAEIHSNKSLNQRRSALDGFKNGKYRVLVATDVASRGIDVKDIQLVINYDLPDASEDYVHRIGRTGRAGKDGHAISLAGLDQWREVQAIERLIGQPLPLSEHSAPSPARSNQNSSQPFRSFGGYSNRSRSRSRFRANRRSR